MTLRELITAALEKKGCSDVKIEESGTDGGFYCWSIVFTYKEEVYYGGWSGIDWLNVGPGVELLVDAYSEAGDNATWMLML